MRIGCKDELSEFGELSELDTLGEANAMDAMGGRKLEATEASPSTYVPHPQQNFIKKKPN